MGKCSQQRHVCQPAKGKELPQHHKQDHFQTRGHIGTVSINIGAAAPVKPRFYNAFSIVVVEICLE